jgi:hypothetical protein
MLYLARYVSLINPLTPDDPYSGRTAPLTSKRCIKYIYSTNIGTEYFKHCIYSQFFSLQNSVCFIIVTYLIPVLFTFYIQDVLKLKKNNSGAKTLRRDFVGPSLRMVQDQNSHKYVAQKLHRQMKVEVAVRLRSCVQSVT